METTLGHTTTYLLIQRNKETMEEMALNYNDYNGMFNPNSEIEYATRWKEVDTAEQIAATQNLIAQLLGQKYQYLVVQEDVIRKEFIKEEPEA